MTDKTLDASGNLQPPPIQAAESSSSHESLLGELVHSAVYAGIQEPISGLTQIADGIFGTNLLPKVQFVSAPEQEKFGTLGWGAEQVGNAAGMLLPFLLLRKGVGAVLGDGAAAEGGLATQRAAIGFSLKESAITGFAYGSLLQPSNYQQGNRLSFLTSRFLDGTATAATFSALTASGLGLSKLAGSQALERSALLPLLSSPITIGALSGIPGGAVSSEISALRSGRAVPTFSELGQSMATYSILGGVFGTANQLTAKDATGQSNVDYLTDRIKQQLGQMKESTSRGLDTVGGLLFPNAGGFGMQPVFAAAGAFDATLPTRVSDFAAMARPASSLESSTTVTRPGGAANGAGDGGGSNAARAAFADLSRKAVVQNKDGQDYVYHALKGTLSQLQARGEVGREWQILPTQVGSPADSIGADYLLMNTRTGDIHMLDGTSNWEKYSNPQQHNVPALREGGLVYFEPKWFDQLGHLRTDSEEPPEVQVAVKGFQAGMADQLVDLTSKSSPFKLGQTPLPQITATEPAQAKAQIDSYLDWVGKNVNDPNVRDYIQTVRRASTHLNIKMNTVSSDQFTNRVSTETDRAVANWAVGKLLGKDVTDQGNGGESNVYYHAKSGHVVLRGSDGTTVDSGSMSRILADSRGRMLNEDNLAKMLRPKQLEQLQAKFPGSSQSQIMQRLQSVITNGASEISTGGSLGTGPPRIINQVVSRLSNQPEARLLQEPQQPQEEQQPQAQHQRAASQPDKTSTAAPDIPANVKAMATLIAEAWRANDLPKVAPGAQANPDFVELLIDDMASDPKQAALKPVLQMMLEEYKNGNPVAQQAINGAIAGTLK